MADRMRVTSLMAESRPNRRWPECNAPTRDLPGMKRLNGQQDAGPFADRLLDGGQRLGQGLFQELCGLALGAQQFFDEPALLPVVAAGVLQIAPPLFFRSELHGTPEDLVDLVGWGNLNWSKMPFL